MDSPKLLFVENIEPPAPCLYKEDFDAVLLKQCLLTSTVNWAQNKLKKNSLLNGFIYTDYFLFKQAMPIESPFVNILYLSSIAHFLCISTVGCEKGRVKVYDSLNCDWVCEELRMQV